MIQYRLYGDDYRSNIVVLGPKGILQADSFHPHFDSIVERVQAGDETVFDLFDVGTGLARRLSELSERVSYNGKDILFDGVVIHSVLADQIRRALETGETDYMPLVKFWEKLEANPNSNSKEQAYKWLATHDFKVTEDGDVVAYKGVYQKDDGEFESTASSRVRDEPSGFVDGVPVPPLSRVPNRIGSVVTMPRNEVDDDPHYTCSRGLHVGDWSYASTYGNAVLEVHVNPRDIVSVPVDANARKVRVSRYKVVQAITAQYAGGPVLRPSDVTETWAGDVGYKPE